MILSTINKNDKSVELLEHREGIDPENYQVGKIGDKIIIYNPDTDKFMEYFYDDKPEEWFSLSLYDPCLGNYKISREGKVINILSRKEIKLRYNDTGYRIFSLSGKMTRLHLLLGKLFIPNLSPNITKFIDHIDRDKNNNSLSNLRWISRLDNNLNRDLPSYNGRQVYFAYKDSDFKTIIKQFSEQEIFDSKDYSKYDIKTSIRNNKSYKNYYWKIDNLDIIEYLKKLNIDKLDESLWKLHYEGNVYVHPLGIVKSVRRNIISLGYSRGGYMHVHIKFNEKFKSVCVHRLVAEVFLNNNEPIEEGLVVDHLNTNRSDNRVENLRICTISENMNNPITKFKTKQSRLQSNS